MGITRRIGRKIFVSFMLISFFNIFITTFILGLGVEFKIGPLDLSDFLNSILLSIVGMIEFLLLYLFSFGFSR